MARVWESRGRTVYSSGAEWEGRVGYCRAVRAGSFVSVSGCTAVAAGGGHVGEGDAYLQTRRCLEIIAESLEKVGSSINDVVRTRMYVVDIDRDNAAVGRAHFEVFKDVLPATSMVQVAKLISPWMLVEVEADAIVL